MKYDNAIRLQKEVEKKIVAEDDFGLIDRVCGVDIAYSGYNGDVAYCSVGVMERDWEFVESVDVETRVTHPYVAGLLMLREAGPILCALDMPERLTCCWSMGTGFSTQESVGLLASSA